MWRSLDEGLASLPDATLMYPGHEYTAGNIAFCLAIEPNRPALVARRDEVRALREQGLPSIPSDIE